MQPILKYYSAFKFSKYQVLAVGVFVLFCILIFVKLNLTNLSRPPTWKNAQENAPKFLIKKALSFTNSSIVDEQSILVMQIPSSGSGKVYIFDFRSSQLCGASGCIYPVYDEAGNLLLQLIANPNLPPKEDLIQMDNTVNQGFPCLVITQNTITFNTVSRSQYCYQGGKYVRFNETLVNSQS